MVFGVGRLVEVEPFSPVVSFNVDYSTDLQCASLVPSRLSWLHPGGCNTSLVEDSTYKSLTLNTEKCC